MRAAATILAALAAVALAGSAHAAPSRRFALVVGNNVGGGDTVDLRYAEDDAKKMKAVLSQIGGYRGEDIVTLLGRSADDVLLAVSDLESRIRTAKEAGDHTTLLLYYSGHAKVGQLYMGASRLPMDHLKKQITESSADIRIGIIDSCESGAITREKGGRRGPSFLFDTDDREAARGLILISSSSEDESSQESDELGGSFFTHYLASGLRGDADESGDQRVTLGEAYVYTYHRTVSMTANTRSGTQHPTYSYDLEGQGDIVLTDLSKGTTGVLFPRDLEGSYLIFDRGRDQIAAEIAKTSGAERRLALPDGQYVVKKRLTDHLRMANFSLARGTYYTVDEGVMEKVAFEDDYAKGPAVRAALIRERATRGTLKGVVMYQSFFSSDARNDLVPPTALFGASLELAPLLSAHIGFELLVGGVKDQTLTLDGVSLPFDFFETQVAVSMQWHFGLGMFDLYVGPRLSGMYLRRSFPKDDDLKDYTQDFFGMSPALSGGVAFFPGDDRNFSIELATRAGYLAFSVENRSLFYGELGLMMGYRL